MFVQAGFNDDCRVLFAAFVRRYGRRWTRPSFFVAFRSGDFAWLGDAGVSWPEQIVIINQVDVPGFAPDYPKSRLPQ